MDGMEGWMGRIDGMDKWMGWIDGMDRWDEWIDERHKIFILHTSRFLFSRFPVSFLHLFPSFFLFYP